MADTTSVPYFNTVRDDQSRPDDIHKLQSRPDDIRIQTKEEIKNLGIIKPTKDDSRTQEDSEKLKCANFRRIFGVVFKEAENDLDSLILESKDEKTITDLQKQKDKLQSIKKMSQLLLFPPAKASDARKKVQNSLAIMLLEKYPELIDNFRSVMDRPPSRKDIFEDKLRQHRETYGMLSQAVYKAYILVDSLDDDAQALLKVGLAASALAIGWSVYKRRKTRKAARKKQADVDGSIERHEYLISLLRRDVEFLVSKIDGVSAADLPSRRRGRRASV